MSDYTHHRAYLTLQLAPVAFFYNVANGFRNMPSYLITNEVHRRRDEIVGLGSGMGVAGKVHEFLSLTISLAG